MPSVRLSSLASLSLGIQLLALALLSGPSSLVVSAQQNETEVPAPVVPEIGGMAETAENATEVAAPGVPDIRGMVQVANVPQTPTVIKTPTGCGFPVTVIPSDTVIVYTTPKDLVTVTASGYTLTFAYTIDLYTDDLPSEGGIVIGMPAGQLAGVSANSDALVQITSGFTNVVTIEKSGNGELMADLSSNQAVASINAEGNAVLTLVGGSFEGGTISGNGKRYISGSWKDGTKSGNGAMTLDGDWKGGTKSGNGGMTINGDAANPNISGNGDVTIYGDVSEGGTKSGNGGLTISGSVTSGSFEAGGNGGIKAGSCDSITTDGNGKCKVRTTLANSSPVVFNEKPRTSRVGGCCGNWWGCSSASAFVAGALHVVLAVVAGVVALAW